MTSTSRQLLAITNAQAGSADDVVEAQVIGVLRTGAQVEVAATSGADDLARALAAHPDLDAVVVLGGDGSLHAVVQALHDADRLDVLVALVPLGTGNDFARTVELPDDPVAAARVVLEGSPRTLDLALTGDGEVVVNAIHVGIGAEAAAAAGPWKRWLGPVGYVIGSIIAGFTRPGSVVEVTVDGVVVTSGRPVLQVGAGLGRFVGGGGELLPEADPGDGELDVVVSTAAPRLRRLGYAVGLRRGEHHRRDDVEYLRGANVTVRGDAVRATNDGELGEPATEHSWTLLPAAWRLVVPS